MTVYPKLVVTRYSQTINGDGVPETFISILPSFPSTHSFSKLFSGEPEIVTEEPFPLTSIGPTVVTVQFARFESVMVSS